MRWPIESAILEGKDELGMDYDEVRGWRGWHHHLTMTFLAHHFLVWVRQRLGEKSTALTVAQVRHVLSVLLPKRRLDAVTVVALITRIQRQNSAAYQAHRRRARPWLDTS
jgi:hypothetical protein